jgi:DNA-binding MarR family transcriptional regulator
MAAMTDAERLTELILQIFRVNGRLLASGDALVEDLGLTSARWQVLGAAAMSPAPLPVAHIARNMGLARQSVQRIVNELAAEGVVALEPNPHHQRAKLVVPTPKGRALYQEARARQEPWAAALAEGVGGHDVEGAAALMRALEARLAEAPASKTGEQ